ncbi:CSMD3 [Branchiostoma lanceolatum]|uniref:CSMD3 protein n=1 Tax=Branchiostoma lanceolatum TaxID=7740 RepID=A0A8J9ZKW9_BRALA|nr:CSMD3 [Branchiostoma lanceolatum]
MVRSRISVAFLLCVAGQLPYAYAQCATPLPPVDGGYPLCTSQAPFAYNFYCYYECNPGYSLSAQTFTICWTGGLWVHQSLIVCTLLDCQAPPSVPLTSSITSSPYAVGTQTVYECVAGYEVVSGDLVKTCEIGPYWSGVDPVCQGCPEPPVVANASWSGCQAPYELVTLCTYTCDDGFIIDGGDEVKTCSAGLIWAGMDLICLIDGSWGDWSSFSACSSGCGFGLQSRTRTCTNPAPAGDGADCAGAAGSAILCFQTHQCSSQGGPLDPSDGVTSDLGGLNLAESNASLVDVLKWRAGQPLPDSYENDERPIPEARWFETASRVHVLRLNSISEDHANLSMTVQYELAWFDPRLVQLTTTWMPVPPGILWSPPLQYGRTVRGATTVGDEGTTMWLNSNGMIVYKITRKFKLTCGLELARFPFDTQVCSTELHAYNGVRLRFFPSSITERTPMRTDILGVVSQYRLTGVELHAGYNSLLTNTSGCNYFAEKCDYNSVEECEFVLFHDCDDAQCHRCKQLIGECRYDFGDCSDYPLGSSTYSTVGIKLHLRRRLWRYTFTLFFPSVVVVLSSLFQTWLPLTTSVISARVVLGSTSLLVMVKQSIGVHRVLWATEAQARDIWLFGCLALVIVALLETAIAHNIYCWEERQKKKRVEEEKVFAKVRIPRPKMHNPYLVVNSPALEAESGTEEFLWSPRQAEKPRRQRTSKPKSRKRKKSQRRYRSSNTDVEQSRLQNDVTEKKEEEGLPDPVLVHRPRKYSQNVIITFLGAEVESGKEELLWVPRENEESKKRQGKRLAHKKGKKIARKLSKHGVNTASRDRITSRKNAVANNAQTASGPANSVPTVPKTSADPASKAHALPVFIPRKEPKFKQPEPTAEPVEKPKDITHRIDEIARLLLPLSFIIFNIVYWAHYMRY